VWGVLVVFFVFLWGCVLFVFLLVFVGFCWFVLLFGWVVVGCVFGVFFVFVWFFCFVVCGGLWLCVGLWVGFCCVIGGLVWLGWVGFLFFLFERRLLLLGRHVGFPTALEGALKLKELSYLHAEGYPAGELKHGPLALIEPGVVVVAVVTDPAMHEKMLSNLAEVKARGASVVAVATDDDESIDAIADYVLRVPATEPMFSPMVDVVPLQLFAYAMARGLGRNIDRPRNLAKTVTVE